MIISLLSNRPLSSKTKNRIGIIVGAAQYIIFHIRILYIAYFIDMANYVEKLNEIHKIKTQCSEPNTDNLLASIPIQVAKQLGNKPDSDNDFFAKTNRVFKALKDLFEMIKQFFETLFEKFFKKIASLRPDPKAKTNEDIQTETLVESTSVAINSAIQLNRTAYDLSNNVFNYFDVFIFSIFVFLLILYYMIQIFIPPNNPYHTIVYNQILGLTMIPVLYIVFFFKKKMKFIESMYNQISRSKPKTDP